MTNIRWTDQSEPATLIHKDLNGRQPARNEEEGFMVMTLCVPYEDGKGTLQDRSWTAWLSKVASWPSRVISSRDLLQTLSGMSDRELADIGLSRGDIRDATAVSLGDDPSELLLARVVEHRRLLTDPQEKRQYGVSLPASCMRPVRSRQFHPLLHL